MDLSNQEYYVLLKRVNQNLVLTEFTLEKMNIFKDKLINLLKKLAETSNPSDIILLPTIFFVLKRSFYKLKKDTKIMLRQMNSKNNFNDSFIRKNSNGSASNDKNSNLNSNINNINSNSNNNEKSNPNNQILFKYKDENEKKNFVRNGELLLESMKISCNFLDVNIHEDISISALNYIYKFLEEPIYFELDNKIHVVKIMNGFFNLINILMNK